MKRLRRIPTKVREVITTSHLNFSETVKRSLGLLTYRDRLKVRIVVALQIVIAGLDLVGIALIGALSALAVNGVRSQPAGNRVSSFLEFLNIEDFSFQSQAAILGFSAAALLVTRTVLSIVFSRRTYFFLSRRSAYISHQLIGKLLQQSLLDRLDSTSQNLLYAITAGVNAITLRIIGSLISLISDGALLVVILLGLLILDPTVALSTLVLFSSIAFILYKLMHQKAETLGREEAEISISSNKLILEALETYRETLVRNRQSYYANEIGKLRYSLSDIVAELTFMPNVSKYVIEIAIVTGALILSMTQFLLQDSTHAIATLAVFLAASTRIAPAIIRLQQSSIVIRGASGVASPTLDLIKELQSLSELPPEHSTIDIDHEGFNGQITLEKVNFRYLPGAAFSLKDLNISIPPGSLIAIVGPSGSGKTTLVDLILGLIEPESGTVRVSGLHPIEVPKRWPGVIGYVPQNIYISDGSIKENICLGYDMASVDPKRVQDAITDAQLSILLTSLEKGLDSQVGERGTKLSGGERQRVGIARALYTKPKLLILDEASSALDAQTEQKITTAIENLKGKVTTIVIAHRLSTIVAADRIIYLENGGIRDIGSFSELCLRIPEFKQNAGILNPN